jgi:hypothetical protein
MDIQEMFEDRKGVIRGRTPKNDRQKENEDKKEYSGTLYRRRTYMQSLKIQKE